MAKYSNTIAYQIQTKLDATGLNQLQQQLSSVSKSFTEMGKNNSAYAESTMKKDISNIQQVQQALSKSFNTNLNLIDLTSFKKELGNLSFGDLQKTMSQTAEGSKAFNSILGTVGQIDTGFKNISSLSDKIMNTFGNTVRWGVTASIFQTIQNSLYSSVDYVKELDTSLNNIQIVTGETSSNLTEWAKSANEAAAQLGASTVAFTDAAQLYAQNGYSQEDYTKLAELTTKVANVTQQSTSEVSEEITSLMAGYKMSIDEAEDALSGMATVAAASASDLGELATAEQKVASAASTLGVSQDELTAQLSTIISVTREAPEQVGNSLKTIYARLGDLSLGETLEDGVSLGDVSSTLEKVGVTVLDVNGDMRSMGDILEDLMAKWSDLSQAEQQALAVKLAGKYQYNNLMTLMNNSDMYYEQKNMAGSSQGALDEQQAIYMESMEAKLQTLQTKWEGVIQSVVNADAFKPFIDAASTGLDIVSDIADTIGGMGPALTLVASLMTKAFSQNIAAGITNMVTNQKRSNLLSQNEDAIISTMGGSDLNGTAATFLKSTVGNRSTLTGEQAVDYNEKLQRYVEVDNQYIEAEQKLAQVQAENIQYLSEKGIFIDTLTGKVKGWGAAAYEAMLSENTQLSNTNSQYALLNETISTTIEGDKLSYTEEELKKLKSLLADLAENNNFDDLRGDVEAFVEQLEKGDAAAVKLGKELSKQLNDKMKKNLQKQADNQKEYTDDKGVTAQERVNKVSNATQDARTAALAKKNAAENALADAQSIAYQQLTQQITNVISSIGQMAFAWQSFQSLGSIWADNDITTGEKLYKTFLSIVTTIPQVISAAQTTSSAFKQIQAALTTVKDAETDLAEKKAAAAAAEAVDKTATDADSKSKNENKDATKAAGDAAEDEAEKKAAAAAAELVEGKSTDENTEKKEENIIATTAQAAGAGALATAEGAAIVTTNLFTTAVKSLSAAFKANRLGIFLTVLGAVASGVSFVTGLISSMNEEALEDQAEKVEEVKTAWDELTSKVSTFETAYETFKSTGEVTDDFTQSCKDAAEALGVEGANALIAAGKYDELAAAIKHQQDVKAQESIEKINENSSENNKSLNGTWNNGSTEVDYEGKLNDAKTQLAKVSGANGLGLDFESSNDVYQNISKAEANIAKLQEKLKEYGSTSSFKEAQANGYNGDIDTWTKETQAIQGAIDKMQEYLDLEDVKTAKDNASSKAEIGVSRNDFQDAVSSAGSVDDIKKIFSGESSGGDYGTADYFKSMEDDYSAQLEYMIANVEDANAKAKLELEQSKISFGQALFTKIKDTTTDSDGNNLYKDEEVDAIVKQIQDAIDKTDLTDSQKVELMAGIDWSKSLPEIMNTLNDGIEELENQLPAIKIDTDTTDLTNAISAKSSMSSLVSQYDDTSGLTEDEVADIVSENPDYLQYLTKVGDNYVLNKNALEEWNKVSEEQTEQLEAAQGKFNSAFFDDYQDSLDEAIQKTRELSEAATTKGFSDDHDFGADASALSSIADMGQAVSDASTALENGEISVQEYFNSFDEAFNSNNIKDIFDNLDTYAEDTEQTILELASTLQEGLANGVSQASKQVKNGQMSLTDYNKIMRKAAESAEEYQAGLKGLRKEGKRFVQITDDEKDGVENLTDEQQEFVDSCDKVEDAIQGSYAVDDMSQALTDNYDYLSSFMDDLGNVNANVDWNSIIGTEDFQNALSDMGNGFASYISGSEENLNTFAANMGMTGDELVANLGVDKETLISNSEAASGAYQKYAVQDEDTFSSTTQASMSTAAGGISTIASYAGTAIDALGSLIGGFEAGIQMSTEDYGVNIDYFPLTIPLINQTINIPIPKPFANVKVTGSLTGSSADAASTLSSSLKNLGGAVSQIDLADFKPGGSGSSLASPSDFGNTGSSGSGGSGGSSGGSGNDDYSDDQTELTENEIDRYEKVNAHLDDIASSLDTIADEQDRLTGQKYIENISKQISLLKEEVEWEEKKLEIEKQEAAEYKNILANDYGVTFNSDGFIENYADIYNQLLAVVNDYERQYNATTSKSAKDSIQDQIDSAQDRLDKFSDYIEKYDELLTSTIKESEQKIQQYYNDIEDLQIEAFNKRLEATSNVKDLLESRADFNTNLDRLLAGDYGDEDPYYDTINALEQVKAYWDADSEAMQEYYDTLIAKQQEIVNSSDASDAEKKWAQSRIDNYTAYKEGHAGDAASDTGDGLLSVVMKDLADVQEQYRQFQETGTSEIFGENSAELLESLQTAKDNAEDVIETLKDDLSDVLDGIIDQIDTLGDEIDDRMDDFDNITDQLDSYLDIIEAVNGDEAYEQMNTVLAAQIQNGNAQIENIKQTIQVLKSLQSTMQEGSDEWEEVQEKIEDAQDELLEKTSDTLDKIATQFENKITSALNGWVGNIFGNSDLDWLGEEWEMIERNAEQYLDDVNSAYNIQKLQSKYLDLLDNSNQLSVQNQITEQMNQQLDCLRKKDKLSQYDVDHANAQFEILQKTIALQEAQANKSQMKLKRDNQGNYSYVYTANESDISSAQSDLLDAENNAYNLSKDNIVENQQNFYSAIQSAYDTLLDTMTNTNLSMEEKAKRQEEIIDSLTEYVNGCSEQLSTSQKNILTDIIGMAEQLTAENQDVMQDVMDAMDEGNEAVFNALDKRLGAYATTTNEAMKKFTDAYEDTFGSEGTVNQALKEYSDNLSEVSKSADLPLTNMANAVGEVKSQMDSLNSSTETYISTLADMSGKIETSEAKLQEMRSEISNAENEMRAFQGQYNDVSEKLVVSEREKADLQGQYKQLQEEYDAYKAAQEAAASGGGGGGDGDWSPYDDAYRIWMYGDYGHGGYWYGNYAAQNGTARADQVLALFNSGYGYTWMDTGGYTGDWGPGEGMSDAKNGKVAVLHSKELVLNATDTENILAAVNAVRQLTTNFRNGAFEDTVEAFNKYGSDLLQSTVSATSTVDQEVHIEATFPNVKGAEEIEQALLSLTNGAVQYAGRSGQ